MLCRLALEQTGIDAVTFGFVRILSAALFLVVPAFCCGKRTLGGGWLAAVMLTGYVFAFSLAYNELTTGTGALLLFGAVQLTMVFYGVWSGESLGKKGLAGAFMLISGMVFWLLPGLAKPSFAGIVLMTVSGCCWGGYSLLGRGDETALAATAGNFLRAVLLAVIGLAVLSAGDFHNFNFDMHGVLLAFCSGSITSGLGYILWYQLLPFIPTIHASLLQLTVPLLAAAGGLMFLGEQPTARFAIAAATVFAGVCGVFIDKHARSS